MNPLRDEIAEIVQDAICNGGMYLGGADEAADAILAIPTLDPTPIRERILAMLGGLRDNMTPAQVRTVQWFADQFPPLA